MNKTVVVLILASLLALPAHAQRLKDLAGVAGVRGNQLVGYGLVVGLDGTGDQTRFLPGFDLDRLASRFGERRDDGLADNHVEVPCDNHK